MAKATLTTIGNIGQCEVVDYEGTPCLKMPSGEGRFTVMGPSKIKTVLANADVCRAFLAQYDKAKTAASADNEATDALRKQVAEMQAKIASLIGQKPEGNERFQPQAAVSA